MAEKKSVVKGIYNWTFMAIAIVAVILVNVISSFVYTRVDMTEDQRYSLADGTVDFLENTKNFKSRLNIKIYLEGNLPSEIKHFRDAIEDKLKEFKLYAGDRIEYQFINPQIGTEEEKRVLFENIYAEGKHEGWQSNQNDAVARSCNGI
jgi:ABC-2 type transport system permease protein